MRRNPDQKPYKETVSSVQVRCDFTQCRTAQPSLPFSFAGQILDLHERVCSLYCEAQGGLPVYLLVSFGA